MAAEHLRGGLCTTCCRQWPPFIVIAEMRLYFRNLFIWWLDQCKFFFLNFSLLLSKEMFPGEAIPLLCGLYARPRKSYIYLSTHLWHTVSVTAPAAYWKWSFSFPSPLLPSFWPDPPFLPLLPHPPISNGLSASSPHSDSRKHWNPTLSCVCVRINYVVHTHTHTHNLAMWKNTVLYTALSCTGTCQNTALDAC